MTEPTVTCVMLTADRPELASRAVACFIRQTYPNKALLIYDTGETPLSVELDDVAHAVSNNRGLPIGALRNNANGMVSADIIMHWDDDDWSHPNRITEQVALLQESGAECVGYNEMLFWRDGLTFTSADPSWAGFAEAVTAPMKQHYAAAWIYTNVRRDYALGTSLCYWRKTWEKKQFRDDVGLNGKGRGEDYWFIQGMKVWSPSPHWIVGHERMEPWTPPMIARIHAGNASAYQRIEESTSWARVPQWDERVREILG